MQEDPQPAKGSPDEKCQFFYLNVHWMELRRMVDTRGNQSPGSELFRREPSEEPATRSIFFAEWKCKTGE